MTLDAASGELFEIKNPDGEHSAGLLEIGWKDGRVPENCEALFGRTKTVTVNVWLNGSEAYSATPNLSFKINVLVK